MKYNEIFELEDWKDGLKYGETLDPGSPLDESLRNYKVGDVVTLEDSSYNPYEGAQWVIKDIVDDRYLIVPDNDKAIEIAEDSNEDINGYWVDGIELFDESLNEDVDDNFTDDIYTYADNVMASYQNANKWLDSVKEAVYTDMNCPFFSSFIHELAHTMPGRFDKFGDILHTVDMKIPYPATAKLENEPQNIDEAFDTIFKSLDEIKNALNDFISATDNTYHGMACATEELLNDIESEYPMLYRLKGQWKSCNGDMVAFDKYVMQYVEHKDDLLESLDEKLKKPEYDDENELSHQVFNVVQNELDELEEVDESLNKENLKEDLNVADFKVGDKFKNTNGVVITLNGIENKEVKYTTYYPEGTYYHDRDFTKDEKDPIDRFNAMLNFGQYSLEESLNEAYTQYDREDGWTDEDIELHKSIDWKARNYEEYPVEGTEINYTIHLYGVDPIRHKSIKMIKYLRSNPIYPPYYAAIDKKPFGDDISYVGPMYDGQDYKGYGVHNRYETQKLYDMMFEDTEKKSNGKWVNKGEDGEHGEFRTKKEADAQRKAMFANGFRG